MSILSKFFGTKPQTENQATMIVEPQTTVAETQQENIPPVDLFIDNEVPQAEQQVAVETQNKITVFLNRNYHSMGTNDGYEYHSQEILEIGKRKIRAEFQLIIDQSIQEKFGTRLQIKNLIVDVNMISDDARQRLENTVEELNSSILILEKQKELSAESEGWVMNAVHSYHQGFVQGLNDYIKGENLLNSIKNI
jgi:hypothetical protein